MSVAELPDLAGAEVPDLAGSVAPGRAPVVRLVPPAAPSPPAAGDSVEDDATITVSPLARFVGGPFPNLRPASRTAEGPFANLVTLRS
jgi:hypothetical protein